MIINNNMMAKNSHRMMTINASTMGKSTEKLSSGLRVNRAADDAAGLSISEKMRAQIRGLTQASRNAQDAISVVQTAEGALDEAHNILQRMRQLAVQSANDSNVKEDRDAIQKEVDQLTSEIDRIATVTEFNTQKLLDGSFEDRVFHVGANKSQKIEVSIKAMSGEGIGLYGGLSGAQPTDIPKLQEKIVQADGSVSALKASLAENASVISGIKSNIVVAETNLAKAQATIAIVKAKIATFQGTIAKFTQERNLLAEQVAQAEAGTLQLTEEELVEKRNRIASLGTSIVSYQSSIEQANTSVAAYNASVAAYNESIATYKGSVVDQTHGEGGKTSIEKKLKEKQELLGKLWDELGDPSTGSKVDVSTQVGANRSIKIINDALTRVSEQRSTLGAIQNRMEHTIRNLDNAAENTQAAESRIRDVDMALEMSQFTKKNILTQASQAMLAQANQLPQQVLQLLR